MVVLDSIDYEGSHLFNGLCENILHVILFLYQKSSNCEITFVDMYLNHRNTLYKYLEKRLHGLEISKINSTSTLPVSKCTGLTLDILLKDEHIEISNFKHTDSAMIRSVLLSSLHELEQYIYDRQCCPSASVYG
ncbi:MAG: hypothetical protein SWO11_05710 [Thermodesulfobacteriota bacterium]|nr:hypothetical protein [Thermodesulfobacteriota bacterium]